MNDDNEEKSSKSKLVIIILLISTLLLGGMAAAYFTGMLDKFIISEQKSDDAQGDSSKGDGSKNKGESNNNKTNNADLPKISYHHLPEFVANLNPGSATPSFIKMSITVELANPELLIKIQEMQPKILDVVNIYLRELRPSDLKGSAGIQLLREELTLRFNKILYPDKINNILFKELLIQ